MDGGNDGGMDLLTDGTTYDEESVFIDFNT